MIKTKLCINIVSYNALTHMESCLEQLEWVNEANDVEVLIVDNASTQGNYSMIKKKFPWIHLYKNETNEGFGKGHNFLFEKASQFHPEFILIINPDVLIERSKINELISRMDLYPNVGIVGPRLINDGRYEKNIRPDLNIWMYVLKGFGIDIFEKQTEDYYLGLNYVPALSGACMLIRREAIDAVGYFDPAYFMYVEDQDLCLRFRKAGWKILYDPKIQVYHALGKSSEDKKAQHEWLREQLYKSTFIYFRKFRPFYEIFLMYLGRTVEMLIRVLLNKDKKFAVNILRYMFNKEK